MKSELRAMTGHMVLANGAAIPRIGLGTGRLRGDEAVAAIHAALDHGYDHIDTAAKYGNEVEVGEAIRSHRRPRDEIFITTKVMPELCQAGDVRFAVDESLARLRVDHVDLLLIHWPAQTVSLAGQIDALCAARRGGLTKHIGVSNFPPRYIEAAVKVADEPLAINQIEQHPYLDQTVIADTCARHGIATVSFSPIGRGALLQEPVVAEIARTLGRTPAQVVLRWHVEKPMNAAVPCSRDPKRIGENIRIFDFELTPEQHRRISQLARPDGRVVRGPPGYDWSGVPL
jgi:diketogulonate reductase-like aldo/keto reductase